ncbi:MAG: hypothetical protein Q8S03_10160 [Brevundimonas sp.]|uniref:DUF6950 family protein n=1 Tax=Brevundimonas sp. TaxID=1871086 RepID=UPI002735EAF2|nr:hypothetical protein [Brevundimonas sp.]MDP3405042.1 hypothetical protein [Brevundimonas sp.]
MTIARNPDALIAYLEAREGWVFGYGPEPKTHDCVRFMAGGIAAVTGIDPLARFGAEWTTARGARRVLARAGGLVTAVSSVMTEIAPARAMRGDGGLVGSDTLVLIEGQTVVGLASDRGLIRLPRAALIKAWTV